MTKIALTHTGFTDENTMKLYNEGWSGYSRYSANQSIVWMLMMIGKAN